MKNLYPLILLLLIPGIRTYAQEQKSEYEIIKSIFDTEKRSYYEKYMELTDAEEKVFWPIYEDYEIDRAKYSRKRLNALAFFAKNYGTMSVSQARNFMDDIFDYQKKEIKLKKKYFRLMNSKMSAQKAVRFMEIEEYINSSIKIKILENLPFIQE